LVVVKKAPGISFLRRGASIVTMTSSSEKTYANRHIPAFLSLPDTEKGLLVIKDGSSVTAERLFRDDEDDDSSCSLRRPMLIRDSPQSVGMKLPPKRKGREAVTVRDIADVVGHAVPVHVIDVEFQKELEDWTWGDLVDYFEDEERLSFLQRGRQEEQDEESSGPRPRPRRKAAAAAVSFADKTRHRVLNQISFEFSETPLAKKVRSPQFVRDIDWIQHAWPAEGTAKPTVHHYCLTSASGCYTDFHLDFGGSSVFYHVLSGSKVFVLIKPTSKALKVYEDWLCRNNQAELFLPDLLEPADRSSLVMKVTLKQEETFIIPSGWIHAVYTPEDSLVFGGNFLHGLDMRMQLAINSLEVRTRVLERFRFPHFIPTQFYAIGMYLGRLRRGEISKREVEELPAVLHACTEWWKVQSVPTDWEAVRSQQEPTVVGAALYAAEQNGCATVEELFEELKEELSRVSREGICPSRRPKSAKSNTIMQPSPKIRLRLSSPTEKPKEERKESFRIKLSAGSSQAVPVPSSGKEAPPPPKKSVASWIDEKEVLKDEEWTPTKKTHVSPPSSLHPPAKKVRLRLNPSKHKSSARERLLKKTA
jgi:F-box/leucine-rich repeat protein 10/11